MYVVVTASAPCIPKRLNLYSIQKVDFEESAAQGRFVVKVGVDPELDQSKLILFVCHFYLVK